VEALCHRVVSLRQSTPRSNPSTYAMSRVLQARLKRASTEADAPFFDQFDNLVFVPTWTMPAPLPEPATLSPRHRSLWPRPDALEKSRVAKAPTDASHRAYYCKSEARIFRSLPGAAKRFQ
jgi:hypothetical protein